MRRLIRILLGILGEISDESAYRRHLAAHGVADSPEEYRRFADARLGAKYGQPKCC